MIGYKLTDAQMQTCNRCQWEICVAKTASGKGKLCSDGWLHYYETPLVAGYMNPVHSGLPPGTMRLFRCRTGRTIKRDHDLKSGATRLTLLEELPVPTISTAAMVRVAILLAKRSCDDPAWNEWADRWLSGEDRSQAAARAAWEVDREAAWAARAAARAAEAAASEAARAAAWAAASAAAWAAGAAEADLGLYALIVQAMKEEDDGD
jgi:hypothetical protein